MSTAPWAWGSFAGCRRGPGERHNDSHPRMKRSRVDGGIRMVRFSRLQAEVGACVTRSFERASQDLRPSTEQRRTDVRSSLTLLLLPCSRPPRHAWPEPTSPCCSLGRCLPMRVQRQPPVRVANVSGCCELELSSASPAVVGTADLRCETNI